tara:strand:+ start:380 stop:622 length:243 start_codon:yes stop_codon:yes gene_type:complete
MEISISYIPGGRFKIVKLPSESDTDPRLVFLTNIFTPDIGEPESASTRIPDIFPDIPGKTLFMRRKTATRKNLEWPIKPI